MAKTAGRGQITLWEPVAAYSLFKFGGMTFDPGKTSARVSRGATFVALALNSVP